MAQSILVSNYEYNSVGRTGEINGRQHLNRPLPHRPALLPLPPQHAPYLPSRPRRAEQESLHLVAAERAEQIELLLRLDAFRRRDHVLFGGDVDDGADDR